MPAPPLGSDPAMVRATGRTFHSTPRTQESFDSHEKVSRSELQKLLTIVIAALAVGRAAAQPKISPRLERSGGSAYVVVFRPGTDMLEAQARMRERGFDLIEHPDLRPRDVLAAG